MRFFVFCCLFLAFSLPLAYTQTLNRWQPTLQNAAGTPYKLSWAGGLNAPQLSEADLNNDGRKDLFIFDRNGDVPLTFLNLPTGYSFAPEYALNFPNLNDWALLRDYNGDNIADIFTYNDGAIGGIRVFKGKFINGKIAFDRVNFASNGNILSYPNNGFNANIYVNNVDIPALDDIDSDGDLDILSFEVGGGHVGYYRNMAVERSLPRDTLRFELEDFCWGRFFDNGFSSRIKLGARDTCASNLKTGGVVVQARHPGASLCTYDLDNDGDKEVIVGSISYTNLNALTNAGTARFAYMNAQDSEFPSNTEGVNLTVFPAAYILDMDNDGKKDMVVTPSVTNFIENYNVAWWYKNTGSNAIPSFNLQRKDFLVSDMLDLGTGANPAWVDYDADGLMDLVVGNGYFYRGTSTREARLFLFKNIGTAQMPAFRLIDDNWLNFKALSDIDIYNFAPHFGDLDGDGDLDLVVGENTGTLFFVENRGGANRPLSMAAPVANWQGIEGGNTCHPQIVDLNRDGLPDIVTGVRNGNLRYFQNTGTRTAPRFSATPTNDFLGRVDVRANFSPTGYAAPYFIDFNGRYVLFVGTESGKLSVYDSIENRLAANQSFRLVTDNYGQLREGERLTPTIRNWDGTPQLELLAGNQRGGLSAFVTTYNPDGTVPVADLKSTAFELFPNPNSGVFTIKTTESGFYKGQIFNTLGQVCHTFQADTPQYDLQLGDFAAGLYLILIEKQGVRQWLKWQRLP